MKRRHVSFFFLVLGVTILNARIVAVQTNTIIIPKEAEAAFGSTFGDPFFSYVPADQVYAATEFATLPDVIMLSAVALRVNDGEDGMDAVVPRLGLRMNVFRGTMQDVVAQLDASQEPIITVFDRQNVALIGNSGDLGAFDIKFSFETPFMYDRRLGQLVISFEVGDGGSLGNLASMDAHGNGGSYDRGAYLLTEPFGIRRARPIILATEFSYTTVFAVIDAIHESTNGIQIDFRVPGNAGTVLIEGSAEPSGPYIREENARLATTSPGRMRAHIPAVRQRRFFRVRVD